MKRIVFCSDTSCKNLEELEYEKLGEVNGGVWVAIENTSLLSILKKCLPITILFFTEAEMLQALEGVNEQQSNEIIQKQCKSSSAEDWETQYLAEFQKNVKRGLNIISQSYNYLNENEQQLIKEYSYKLVLMWTQFGNDSFYDEEEDSVVEEIEELLELKSELIFEAEDGLKQLQYSDHIAARQNLAKLINYNKSTSQKLSLMLKENYDSDYDIDLLYDVNLERGVYSLERNEALESNLKHQGYTVIPWEDGFIGRMPMSSITRLEKQGKKLHIIYIDPYRLSSDEINLNSEQFTSAVNNQIQQLKNNPDKVWFNYLYSKQLNLIWHMTKTFDMFKSLYPEDSANIYTLLTSEVDHLVLNLLQFPVWIDDIKIDSKKIAIDELIKVEKHVIADAEYFSALSLCENDKKNHELFIRIRKDRIESIGLLEKMITKQ